MMIWKTCGLWSLFFLIDVGCYTSFSLNEGLINYPKFKYNFWWCFCSCVRLQIDVRLTLICERVSIFNVVLRQIIKNSLIDHMQINSDLFWVVYTKEFVLQICARMISYIDCVFNLRRSHYEIRYYVVFVYQYMLSESS